MTLPYHDYLALVPSTLNNPGAGHWEKIEDWPKTFQLNPTYNFAIQTPAASPYYASLPNAQSTYYWPVSRTSPHLNLTTDISLRVTAPLNLLATTSTTANTTARLLLRLPVGHTPLLHLTPHTTTLLHIQVTTPTLTTPLSILIHTHHTYSLCSQPLLPCGPLLGLLHLLPPGPLPPHGLLRLAGRAPPPTPLRPPPGISLRTPLRLSFQVLQCTLSAPIRLRSLRRMRLWLRCSMFRSLAAISSFRSSQVQIHSSGARSWMAAGP